MKRMSEAETKHAMNISAQWIRIVEISEDVFALDCSDFEIETINENEMHIAYCDKPVFIIDIENDGRSDIYFMIKRMLNELNVVDKRNARERESAMHYCNMTMFHAVRNPAFVE